MHKIYLILLISSFIFYNLFSQQPKIGVVPAGSGQIFWDTIELGAKKAAEELGYTVYFRGPSDESNFQAQEQVINLLARDIVGLVLAPNVNERDKDVEKLKLRGIPTVYIDTGYIYIDRNNINDEEIIELINIKQ